MKISPLFGAAPLKLKPTTEKAARDVGVLEEDGLRLLGDVGRVPERRAGRGLDDADEVALVLVGHEGRGHRLEEPPGAEQAQGEETEHERPQDERALQGAHVAVRAAVDHAVHAREEPAVGVGLLGQQQRGEGGGEGHRVEDGEDHGEGDGQRELLVEPAGGAREEGDGHEHRHQHEPDDHHRAEHLAHGVDGRLVGALLLLAHVALDVLDHHDRVVHDDPGGEHDPEQGQGVDGEAEELHEGEGADQRDRDGDGGDERAAPVLQEQEHHEDDEDDGLDQGDQHFLDRLAHDAHVVEGQPPLQTGRERLLQARHLLHDALVDLERVGGGQELDAHAGGLEPDEAQVGGVGLRAQLHAADVADAHEGGPVARLHHDVRRTGSAR